MRLLHRLVWKINTVFRFPFAYVLLHPVSVARPNPPHRVPRCTLHNLAYPARNVAYLIFSGNFMNFTLLSFNITSVVSLRQSSVSPRVSLGQQQSVVNNFRARRTQCRCYNMQSKMCYAGILFLKTQRVVVMKPKILYRIM